MIVRASPLGIGLAVLWVDLALAGDKVCGERLWRNAFQPTVPVNATDCQLADPRRQLFTREGALACPTVEAFQLASNAMSYNWLYPWADLRRADQVSEAQPGCRSEVAAPHFQARQTQARDLRARRDAYSS